jgi:type II secretory pathway pseudopilin PulG
VIKRLIARVRAEEGFGLIELAIAIVMLNIGILALVATFQSGSTALSRANAIANATAVADRQMEQYRALRNCAIYLTSTSVTSANANAAYVRDKPTGTVVDETTVANGSIPASCASPAPPATATLASQTILGADNRTYTVDTYIVVTTATGGGSLKQVTLVVRDPKALTNSLFSESSTFDPLAAP